MTVYRSVFLEDWRLAEDILRGLWKYDLRQWTVEDVFELLLSGKYKLVLDGKQLKRITQGKTNLLDPYGQEELTLDQVIKKAKENPYYKENIDKERPIWRPEITRWPDSEDELVELFPFRSPADAPFRRARLSDLKHMCPHTWLNDFRNQDYITATNLMFARLIHGEELVAIWRRLEMLNSLNNFIIGANSLNLVMKKYKIGMPMRLMLAEGANLTGYRQMPMPGFDIVKETQSLCEGGEEHGVDKEDWLEIFEEAAKQVMHGQEITPVTWRTLEEFIKDDLASTAGASSIGKVKYVYEGEKGKFKARKNLLYDIMTPEEIYKVVVSNYDHQTATAFVKPEMGKLRIAVTGDIESYYVCSWLNYLAGHCYTTWHGNTLEESRVDQMTRMETMLTQLVDSFSIPFDYKGFDHQPTLDEIAIELRLYLSNALYNTPPEWTDYVRRVIDTVIESFRHSVTIVRDEKGKVYKFEVTGGVQSGVRLTSLLGNFWNQTMSRIVGNMLGNPDGIKEKYIRGDDSSIITNNYELALLFRLGYASINAIGADAKYGIHYQETEFLRIWYANDRVYGYPNRAIPSLTQRKPWTSDPWDPEGVVKAQIKTVRLIERRLGRELPEIEKIVIESWSRKRKLEKTWLTVPVAMGGLGVLPWTGRLPDRMLPRIDVEEIKVRFETARGTELKYITRLQEAIPHTSVELSADVALELQQKAMRGKASSDDLPGLNRILRQNYVNELEKFRKVRTGWRSVWTRFVSSDDSRFGYRVLEDLRTVTDLKYVPQPSYFGRYQRKSAEWRAINEVARYQDLDIKVEYAKYAPDFFQDRRLLEKQGMHRTMATDWLFGNYARYSASLIHDQAAKTVETVSAWIVEKSFFSRERIMWQHKMNLIWLQAEKAFARSPINRKLLLY